MIGWNPALTGKLRVLLHASPLLDIYRSDDLRDPKLRHYAALPLAVKALDLIIDRMGIDRELDREAIQHALTPMLSEMDRAANLQPDPKRHDVMVDRLLADLRNDAQHRRPYRLTYKDFDENGKLGERILEFNLVEEHFDVENRVVLRLSNAAINLYLRALDLEIEDAQAAAEAVLESQLSRGRIADALESAKTANLQSVRFKRKIEEIRLATQRDLRRVDWRDSVPKLLEQALNHIVLRLGIEKSILDAAEKQRGELEGEKAVQIAQIWKLVEDCRIRHIELQRELMTIRNVFLDEQQRQAFSLGVTRSRTPEPISDLLEPLLANDAKSSAAILGECAPAFLGARAPSILSLRRLVCDLLRPKRPPIPEEEPLTELELLILA